MVLKEAFVIKFKYYSIFYVFATVQAASSNIPKKFCDIESDSFSKQCFLKEVLVSMAHSPNQLAVDKETNMLYFSFDSGQGEYMPAALKIDTKKIVVLKGVEDAFALAYDADRKYMYFGGSHGIYKYKRAYKDLKRLNSVGNLDVWWLFIKKYIYFIRFPSLNAFYYDNRTIKHVPRLQSKTMHQFVFDNDDNIFFINTTGLYGVKNNSDVAILLRDYPRFLGMALDNKGQIYVCSDDAIFVISKVVQKVKRMVNIQGILGMTFDRNNNIIYSDSHDIVRLRSVSNDNYYEAIQNIISF